MEQHRLASQWHQSQAFRRSPWELGWVLEWISDNCVWETQGKHIPLHRGALTWNGELLHVSAVLVFDCLVCCQRQENIPKEAYCKGDQNSPVLFHHENKKPWDNEIQIKGGFGLLFTFIWSVLRGVIHCWERPVKRTTRTTCGVTHFLREQCGSSWPLRGSQCAAALKHLFASFGRSWFFRSR